MSIEHWVWLSSQPISRNDVVELLDCFDGDPGKVWEAGRQTISDRLGANRRSLKKIDWNMRGAGRIIKTCEKLGISIITLRDAAYPDRLRNIHTPPAVLYVRGSMPSFDSIPSISVVGTRDCSRASYDIAYDMGLKLAKAGILVVSGMAKGIDSAANSGALAAGENTVAVLGCGPDICYPNTSMDIYKLILSGRGAIITEYPPGTRPLGRNFPERNRIISGLSGGILLIAAPERSGSLITANLALEQGRDIYVVPGGVDNPEYTGSNSLIKQGAVPVTSARDVIAQYYQYQPDSFHSERVLSAFNEENKKTKKTRDFFGFIKKTVKIENSVPKEQKKSIDFDKYDPPASDIIKAITEGYEQIDDIIEHTGLQAGETMSVLTDLEIEGTVRSLPGKRFKID